MSSSFEIYKVACSKVFHTELNDSCGLCFNKLGEDAISINEEVLLRCSGEEISEPVSALLLHVLGEKVNITSYFFFVMIIMSIRVFVVGLLTQYGVVRFFGIVTKWRQSFTNNVNLIHFMTAVLLFLT